MNWKQLWQSLRDKACKWYTNGAHDPVPDGSKFHVKCRICGLKWELPQPEPEPQPDPPDPQPDPDPVDPTGEPNPNNPSAQRSGFLWKPVNESGGPLVVLSPEGFTGHIKNTWLEYGGQTEVHHSGAVANGNRYHSRFTKQGGAYPAGVEFHLMVDSGTEWVYTIPQPSKRYDGQITPTVKK